MTICDLVTANISCRIYALAQHTKALDLIHFIILDSYLSILTIPRNLVSISKKIDNFLADHQRINFL